MLYVFLTKTDDGHVRTPECLIKLSNGKAIPQRPASFLSDIQQDLMNYRGCFAPVEFFLV